MGVFGTPPEFCSCFFKSHRIRGAAFSKISAACDNSPVLQVDFQDRCHFVEASALGYIGGLDSAWNKFVFDDHKKTIIYGFVYWAVIFLVGWEILLKNV